LLSPRVHTTGHRMENLFSSARFLQKRVLICGSYRCLANRPRCRLYRRNLVKLKEDSLPMAVGWHTLQTSRDHSRFLFRAFPYQAVSGRYPPWEERSPSGVAMVKSCFISLLIERSWL